MTVFFVMLGSARRVPHCSFLPSVEAEFGMREQSARKLMNVARVYGGKSPSAGDLSLPALCELAASQTLPEVREEVDRLLAACEVVR